MDEITKNPCRRASSADYLPGYGALGLPFSSDPGAFLAEALKALYGVLHHYRCKARFDLEGLTKDRQTVQVDGGLAYIVGGGSGRSAGAVITPVAFSQHGRAPGLGDLTLSHDESRPAVPGLIAPERQAPALDRFDVVADPANAEYFIVEYRKDPVVVYRSCLDAFMPLRQTIKVNARIKVGRRTLVTRGPIDLRSGPLDGFPPGNAQWNAAAPIELVDEKNQNGPVLGVIRGYTATAEYRRDLSSPAFVPAAK